jgi:hypothetical protein
MSSLMMAGYWQNMLEAVCRINEWYNQCICWSLLMNSCRSIHSCLSFYMCMDKQRGEVIWRVFCKGKDIKIFLLCGSSNQLKTSQQDFVTTCKGWHSWFRHCATSRKVTCSIPDGATGIFHWHNPSGRTMALGLSQPLTEMSTRNISWGVNADNLTTFMCWMSWNLGTSTSWNLLGLSRPVMGLLYLYLLFCHQLYQMSMKWWWNSLAVENWSPQRKPYPGATLTTTDP